MSHAAISIGDRVVRGTDGVEAQQTTAMRDASLSLVSAHSGVWNGLVCCITWCFLRGFLEPKWLI